MMLIIINVVVVVVVQKAIQSADAVSWATERP